jgi:hypothetical protein
VRIFVSYASEDRAIAERIHYALTAAGHETFFDRADIEGSADFHQVILNRIQQSDAMVFLITAHSVAPGKYTLTELKHAEQKWRHPVGRVLPVLADRVTLSDVPGYLKAVSILEPKGDVAAEVVTAVASLADLQITSTALTRRQLTQLLTDCPRFLARPRQYVLSRTQRDAPVGHALASSTILFLVGLVAAMAIGARQGAAPDSALFLSVGTPALWLGYAVFLHLFIWMLRARRGVAYTLASYLYVMGFLQPVFAGALFLVTAVFPDAVTYRTVTAGFGGSMGSAVVAGGRWFGGDASTWFRVASGGLILGYFAIAVAAAHRIALWRGILASVLSFVFFTVAFGLLLLADQVFGTGVIMRLVKG